MRNKVVIVLALLGALSLAHGDLNPMRKALLEVSSSTQPENSFRETNYSAALGPFATLDIDRYLQKTAYGLTPEQVNVKYWTPDSVVISWFQGQGVTYCMKYSAAKRYNLLDYCSGLIHHTLVTGLTPKTQYFYQVGDEVYALSGIYNFTSLANTFPVTVAVTADTGQSINSSQTLSIMMQQDFSMIWNIGDLASADTFDSRGTFVCWLSQLFDSNSGPPNNLPGGGMLTRMCQQDRPPTITEAPDTYQPKWDSWLRLWEPAFSSRITFHASGNHEIDITPDGSMFASYNARLPTPQDPKVINTKAVSYFSDKSDDNLYSVGKIPGVATVFMLTTFQPNVVFSSSADQQFTWFKNELAKFNRTETPWLIVNTHVPIYTLDAGTFKVIDCFRIAYEPLFYKYGVDIMFNGHVHAYERTYPMYNYTKDSCGTVHIIVGSGGNNEGVSNLGGWLDQIANKTSWCQVPASRQWPNYQPQRCFSFQPSMQLSQYCPTSVPNWYAYREQGFGAGTLTFKDANTAEWKWYRNLDNGKTVTDQLTIVRGRDSCKYTQACFVALRDTYCDTYIVIGLLGQPKSLSSLSYYGR